MGTRRSGILMHISSLPSKYGIGTMGKSAYGFVDFLEQAGQSLWQILPITTTSYGDSPYQSFSTFAGNPYFIDLDFLHKDGWLKKNEYAKLDWGENEEKVDYGKIYYQIFDVLHIAYKRFKKAIPDDYKSFVSNNDWLTNYALYMAIKRDNQNLSWQEWDLPLRKREASAMLTAAKKLADEINFWKFTQYCFFDQWHKLKSYANQKGIQIIGDIPKYVALDSADVWANPELFQLDENLSPVEVAGCPPDYFAATGQLWGNPIYNWDAIKKTNYKWWIDRMASATQLYDIVRIDHFRGFESYYAIKGDAKTAEVGMWKKGPGMELFHAITAAIGETQIIAEDLGFITPEVHALLAESGYPGMKVLQFAFDPNQQSEYLPFRYKSNCVCYTGTHDNDTILGWLSSIGKEEYKYVMRFTGSKTKEECVANLIATAWGSPANIAVTQMQDILGLSTGARMNIPGTMTGNWQWRIKKGTLTPQLAARLRNLTVTYWRCSQNQKPTRKSNRPFA